MLLGICSDTDTEIPDLRGTYRFNKLAGITVTARLRAESLLPQKGIPTQSHYVLYSEELEILDSGLNIFRCIAGANQVRHNLDIELLLYGGAHRSLADPAAHDMPCETTIGPGTILILVPVAGDINERGLESGKRSDGVKKFILGDALERGHNLQRCERFSGAGQYFAYFHILQFKSYNNTDFLAIIHAAGFWNRR